MVEHVGITGTQHGVTRVQFDNAISRLHELVKEHSTLILHHGSCIGADKLMHDHVVDGQCITCLPVGVILHPGLTFNKRAYCPIVVEERKAKPPLERNHDIVEESKYLIAIPRENEEILRSGTWATVRYAQKLEIPITICYPDGRIVCQ